MRRFPGLNLVLQAVLAAWTLSAAHAGVALKPVLGSQSAEIGTFHGWVGWVGWDATFSESYNPVQETYGWVVYFAPEAIYVALQPAQAVYSGVDVNMGFDFFYGFLRAPNAASTLSRDYLTRLWGVAFSKGIISVSPPGGPMSKLSLGLTVAQTFYRVSHTTTVVPAFQFGAGVSASFSLLPIDLPFSVALDRDWQPAYKDPGFSGFWPIALWNLRDNPTLDPATQIANGLSAIISSGTRYPATTVAMAGHLLGVIQKAQNRPEVSAFLADPSVTSRISQTLEDTSTWLQTSDTGHLPALLQPFFAYPEMEETVQPILAGTQMAFETGYRAGAEANPGNDTVHVDGIITHYCFVGEPVTIEVRAQELVEVITNRTAAEFEGAWIGFDVPVEYMTAYASAGKREWLQITNGVARYSIIQSMTRPQVMGVVYDDDSSDPPLNHGADVELKRRLLIFVDRTDANHNQIPDYWEKRFGLTNNPPGIDTDRDGQSDAAEYIADTDPTNPQALLRLRLNTAGNPPTFSIPATSRDRKYTLESCANLTSQPPQWTVLFESSGTGAEMIFNARSYLTGPAAFFRICVSAP
ncbi:MAG TPA: thrombospondin type 3 repeat-containing protein [Candidatus Paceibacterota bacterium]|nr:thrombospondin type 3 repeat-containing protein [Verrucomicrobiota bacterium]HRY47161.1 thrombospondin type 3 repeat-containing protein [Candidatus Paceibacterota bacterium]HSA00114.1 thrombospondin type 3 repeat-containing protein [Candidatus Paceibacterota bacterium]